MDVVFDTNILVLSLLGDPCALIMDAACAGLPDKQLSFYYSPAMLTEYNQALHGLSEERPDAFRPENVAQRLLQIETHGHLIHPTIRLSADDPDACTHEPDNRFLECALAVQAEYLVTHNKIHFPTHRNDLEIVGPSEFKTILFGDKDGKTAEHHNQP